MPAAAFVIVIVVRSGTVAGDELAPIVATVTLAAVGRRFKIAGPMLARSDEGPPQVLLRSLMAGFTCRCPSVVACSWPS